MMTTETRINNPQPNPLVRTGILYFDQSATVTVPPSEVLTVIQHAFVFLHLWLDPVVGNFSQRERQLVDLGVSAGHK